MSFRFPTRKESDEVYYCESPFVLIGPEDLGELKKIAMDTPRKRARLCVHRSPSARLHEMFITLGRDAYVQPHRHTGRKEGLMVLEGSADLITFSDSGEPQQIVRLNSKCFYSHLDEPLYHMLRIHSDFLVFYEATSGPFQRSDTEFPSWAPSDTETDWIDKFLQKIDSHLGSISKSIP
jgi:cupin fold WbuC family metalloprotein